MKPQHWIIAGVLILAVGWLAWLLVRPPGAAVPVGGIVADDRVQGNPDAKVVLIEYGDFQCPACGTVHPWTQRLVQEQGTKFAYVFRHFPLRSIHPNAEPAARAAEAAAKQGKYWEMHDLLFKNQTQWERSSDMWTIFVGYAQQLGLDGNKFKADRDALEVKQRVLRDIQSGTAARITGTPTFFLNGTRIDTPGTYEAFAKLVTDAIAAQK